MGRVRDADDAQRRDVASAAREGTDPATALEWIADIEDAGAASAPMHEPSNRRTFVASVIAIIIISGLFVVAFGSDSSSDESVAQTPNSIDADPITPDVPITPDAEEQPLIDQLASAPEEWLAGHVLAWVNAQGELQARQLATGSDLPVSVFAQTNTPPLPEHIHLLGGENSTWLLDLESPERSGEFSNTVRIVRLGSGAGRYGFSSIDEGGATGFFVGTLWGPAKNGLAEVDAQTNVISVPATGFVVASANGDSSALRDGAFEPVSSRLGRVVAASPSLLAGIHCDAVGRCVGRVAEWDGTNERVVDAAVLAEPIVRISPNGRYIMSGGGGSIWHLVDLAEGTHLTWPLGLVPDDSLQWSPDSSTAFFLNESSLVAVRIDGPEPQVRRVRSAGDIGPRLPGSDVRVLDS
ncbi:MAG: hypothetical protein R8J94_19030 [Acidimicrobiia bacterium]|nr:hypothetical protein [Acidimicrobiia bacterium]